jgi:hypothetical protein
MNVAQPQSEAPRPKRRWFRVLAIIAIGLLLWTVVAVILLVIVGRMVAARGFTAEFHDTLAGADRIVVRDGGFDCCGPVDDGAVLFEVTDPSEIKAVLKNLEFVSRGFPCMCCGFPGIDWYQGKQRIALTAVQHGQAIRMEGSDWRLSDESRVWLTRWLTAHGVNKEEIQQGCGGPRKGLRRDAAAMKLAQVCVVRGESHAAQGDLDAAIAEFSEAIDHSTDFPRAYYLRGLAYEENGTLDRALQDFTSAIWFSEPTSAESRAKAAEFLSESDRPVELDKNLAPVYYARGRAYEKQGEKAKAEEDFAHARKLERESK